ncbi:hypothetical protein DLM85_08555 [Hymenobacter edaphi]|uniref:Uncharacterized protein n=1 Tax=Hymenobacter edaphi TaxID=2211146 RepID=A0A328BL51_9BACT|nr:hypothetical protein DLM85_08555 [Hymenobacter edaphi]
MPWIQTGVIMYGLCIYIQDVRNLFRCVLRIGLRLIFHARLNAGLDSGLDLGHDEVDGDGNGESVCHGNNR